MTRPGAEGKAAADQEDGEPDGGRPEPSGLPVGDLLASGPVTSDLPTPASVLAVGAHPDDIEFGCGATLAKWAAHGSRLHYVVLTDGSKGTWDAGADPTALIETRMEECRAAAAVVDAGGPYGSPGPDRITFLGRVDGELESGSDERRALAGIIRRVRPAVVLGHDPWRRYRLHPDHRAAGHLTVDAVVAARDHHFFPELGVDAHRPEALLLFEADLPNHVENADGFEPVKIDALLCHRSQLESTMRIVSAGARNGRDDRGGVGPGDVDGFAARVRHQLAQHGRLGGLASGEAFRLIPEL